MILIITHKTDFTADFVVNRLNLEGVPYKRFNCEDILISDTTVSYSKFMNYSVLGENHFSSVWFRRTKIPDIKGLSFPEKQYIATEIESFIKNLLLTIDSKWVSEPYAVYKAENKLYQLKVALKIGFLIPETIVTNSKEKLREFYYANNGNIILKPMSKTKLIEKDSVSFIFTNILPYEYIEKLDDYDLTPCIYQRNIEKDIEIRVTVVGDFVFSAFIDSQSDQETLTDWRRKKLKFSRYDLPKNIAKMCVKIVAELNLKFGCIDLILDTKGNFMFLEINPNGQWAWIETQTGLDISGAIVKLLKQ